MSIIANWWWLALLIGLPIGIAATWVHRRKLEALHDEDFPEEDIRDIIRSCHEDGKTEHQALASVRAYMFHLGRDQHCRPVKKQLILEWIREEYTPAPVRNMLIQ